MESSLEFFCSLSVVRGITNPKCTEYEKFQNTNKISSSLIWQQLSYSNISLDV